MKRPEKSSYPIPRSLCPIPQFLLLLCFLFITPRLTALDFFLRPQGFAFFPLGDGNVAADGSRLYDAGFGGGLAAELDFASILANPLGLSYSAGLEGSILSVNARTDPEGSARFFAAGLSLGLACFPLPRLFTRLDGALGLYRLSTDFGGTGGGLWWRGGAEFGFRITPVFTAAANSGWRQYYRGAEFGTVNNSGLYAGLVLHITLEAGSKINNDGTAVTLAQDGAVYPVFIPLYQANPIGSLAIRNNETAEIRDLRVSFRAGEYTTSEFECGRIPLIGKGRSAELPLYADFSPELLRFADKGRILGEVVIRYRFLGRQRQSVQTVSVAVHNYNAVPEGDLAAFAAFISPTSPGVLEYAKYVTGLARSRHRLGLNQTMEFGVWLFEGLRSLIVVRNGGGEGEAQFPAQTLSHNSGSARDIALLYAAVLEAAGIRAALIALPSGDLLTAFDLGIRKNDASVSALFNGTGKLLFLGDEVWMPVAPYELNGGFTAAWKEGVWQLNALEVENKAANLVIIENAWAAYPPAPFPAMESRAGRPEQNSFAAAADKVLSDYITSEFMPKLAALQSRIGPNSPAKDWNQIGSLYLRLGWTADAKTAYERAAGMGSAAAMTNRGTIALNENNNAAAENWFKQALAREPQNKAALRGMKTLEARR